MARMTAFVSSILPCQEAFLVDAPTPTTSPHRWIQAKHVRTACLTPHGVHLLQQRFIWYLTRFLAPTHRLAEATEAVFEEADLQEEWVETFLAQGSYPQEAAEAFHEWIRSPDSSGVPRQDQLKKTDLRPGLRRQVRTHLQEKFR